MSSNPSSQKSSKLSKSGFKSLSRSKLKKDKLIKKAKDVDKSGGGGRGEGDKEIVAAEYALSSSTRNSVDYYLQQATTTTSTVLNTNTNDNNTDNKSKRKIKKKTEKQLQSTTIDDDVDASLMMNHLHHSTIKNKKKRNGLKLHSHNKSKKEQTKIVHKPVFGVPLDVACSRNPSHDGIVLPAFFRHCIDYIEQYGLSSEGIYRVPGVHSQVQAVIASIDNGIEFPDIPPTSATFYCNQVNYTKQRSNHLLTGLDSNSKGKLRHLSSSSHSKSKKHHSSHSLLHHRLKHSSPTSIGGHFTTTTTPTTTTTNGLSVKTSTTGLFPNASLFMKHHQSPNILTSTITTSSNSPPQTLTTSPPPPSFTTVNTILPHDPAVIASVIKHFLRSLPEPLLTKRLTNVIESLTAATTATTATATTATGGTTNQLQFYHNLSVLIHQELPKPNRYLLAWILQHIMHIIQRSNENHMTLANIIIVLSPCLGISHRLLGILLNSTPPKDFSLDLCKLDPTLPIFINPDKLQPLNNTDDNENENDSNHLHWLFPHPAYSLKPYIPPVKFNHGLELPDTNEELDIELKKQESLLNYLTTEQIQLVDSGDSGNAANKGCHLHDESPSYQLSNAQIKQDRAEKARARRARIMARMSNMQRNFMDSLTQNEATTNEAELMDIDYPEVNNDNLNQSTTTQSTVVQQCALGPTRSLGSAAAYLFPNSSLSSQGGMEVQNTELVTCNLCLEEVAEQASSRMVMAAHVCRSSVLSSHGISWLEGPVTMSVVKRLSSDLDMVDSMCCSTTTIDRHHDKSYSVHGDENQLIPFLASVSTTAAATCAGSSRMGLRIIPELLSGIQCLEVPKDTTTTTTATTELTDKNTLGPGLIDQLFTNQDEMNHSIILDRWHPRPLVSSRDPIAEEGSFFTFCSHPMHATCKTKYAKQIKGRVDNLNRRNSSMLVFEFRCPLCKCISTLDLPMLGPIYLDIPIEWLQSRLLSSINHDQSSVHQLGSTATTPLTTTTTTNINNNHAHFQPLSSWLHNLSRWLDMSSDVNDYILGPLFSSNFNDQKSIMTDHLQNTSTLEDYALWNFGNLITADIINVTYPSYSSTTTPSTSVDMDVDHDYSTRSTSGNNYEFIAQRIHSIMKRVKYSLIVQDSTEQDYHHHELNAKKRHSKTTADCGMSSSSSSSSNVGVGGSASSSSLNPLSRQFWTSRRFSRRSSTDNDNVSMNSSNSTHNSNSNNNNNHATTLSIGNNTLKNLLPPQSSSPLVTTNLFALVQRLASLCQPKSVDTLVQRPIGRRTTTTTTTTATATATATAEVVVNNTPTIVPLPNDINEEQDDDDDDDDGDDGDEDQDGAAVATDQVVAFVVTDTPIQSTASTLSTSNIQVLMTQTEFDSPPSTTTTHHHQHHNLTMNSSSTSLSKQSVLFNANLNLSEAIELFHLDFMSFYERLRTLNSLIPQNVTTTVTSATTTMNAATTTPATTAATTTTNCPKSQLSSHRPVKKKTSSHTTTTSASSSAASSSQAATSSSVTTTTTGVDDDINQRYIMNSFNSTKHYLERIAQRARNVIWSAACEWRSLRHSVAYTLIGSERNFIDSTSRHAVVSRGCSLSCDAAANDDGKTTTTTTGHRLCWSQLKTHPIHWWWWSYCVPFDVVPNSQLKDVLPDCRLNNPSTIINIAETAVSIAATEDARFLWRLLLPPLENYKSDALTSNVSEQSQQQQTNSNTSMPASTYSMNAINQPTTTTTSLLWDVDITSLFISLLHLRPGLEEFTVNQCQCTRLANVANADISQESGTASLGAYLLACDEGRLRLPIGDSHETHLLRLCYAALLVQSLIAWQPRMDCLNYLKKHQLLPQSCTWNDNYVKSAHWNLPELLDVWRLLRDLCGLSAWNSSNNDISNNNQDPQMMAQSLGLFLRANCLPFLRIAAFVIHKITGVDTVEQPIKKSTDDILSSPSFNTSCTERIIDNKIIPIVYNQNALIPGTTTTSTTATNNNNNNNNNNNDNNNNNLFLHPYETTSTMDSVAYSSNHSPSLPPPTDLAPKLSEFMKSTSTTTSSSNSSSTVNTTNDSNSRQILYYQTRKQELIAIQTDLYARIRSENAEISRLQSCINHLLESGGRRANRIYRTYMTAKHLCPDWLLNENPLIVTPPSKHQFKNNDKTDQRDYYHYISQPWTKIAENLTTIINENVVDDEDDDDDEDDHTTATTAYSSSIMMMNNNLKEKCLLDDDDDEEEDEEEEEEEYSSSDSDDHHHDDDDDDDDGDGDEHDSLKEPILTNRDSSPDSVGYLRLTEETEDVDVDKDEGEIGNSLNSKRNKHLTVPGHDDGDDDDDDDDEDEDEEEDECEMELAKTLHQLTLDNARLEQLNARSLDAIQAERNRCADLKVLLKLRHNKPIDTMMESIRISDQPNSTNDINCEQSNALYSPYSNVNVSQLSTSSVTVL
ncbi:unnamed protein product [Schistosoma turkestanicum]|nr:unnamed protein product [Schistosoma turkestanicum]